MRAIYLESHKLVCSRCGGQLGIRVMHFLACEYTGTRRLQAILFLLHFGLPIRKMRMDINPAIKGHPSCTLHKFISEDTMSFNCNTISSRTCAMVSMSLGSTLLCLNHYFSKYDVSVDKFDKGYG